MRLSRFILPVHATRTLLLALALLLPASLTLPVLSVRATTHVVTSLTDSMAAGTLRGEIAGAVAGETITFAPGLTGTIGVGGVSTLVLTKDVTLTGPPFTTGPLITISGLCTTCMTGGGSVRVFVVNTGVTATISNLTITQGRGDATSGGGGILNNGTLTLTGDTITANTTVNSGAAAGFGSIAGSGAGIASIGTLTVTDSVISSNTAGNGSDGTAKGGPGGRGGGIFSSGRLSIVNSEIFSNHAGNGGKSGTQDGADGGSGGGIFTSGPLLTVTGGIIESNTAGRGGNSDGSANGGDGGSGGAIYSDLNGGPVTVTNVSMTGNSTGAGGNNGSGGGNGGNGGCGGGIAGFTALTVTGSGLNNVTGNGGSASGSGRGGNGGNGGSICVSTTLNFEGSLVMAGSDLYQNFTGHGGTSNTGTGGNGGVGGGIVSDGNLSVSNSIISHSGTGSGGNGSGSNGNGGDGGGISQYSGTATVIGSAIFANATGGVLSSGGGIANVGQMRVIGTTISGNMSAAGGGGIANGGTLTLGNDTISNNTAKGTAAGGGIANTGTLTAHNITVTGNIASFVTGAGGGGIRISGGTLDLANSLLTTNTTGVGVITGDYVRSAGTITDNGNNFVTYASPSTDFSGAKNDVFGQSTAIGTLADNGGAVILLDNTHPLTIALPPGNNAINRGNAAFCAASPVSNVDERGVTRPKGSACDIGAFEVLSDAATLTPTTYAVGTAGGRVTLIGTNLESVTGVTIDGVAVTVGIVSSGGGTRLSVPIPAHATGSVAVVLTNPGTTGVSATLVYTDPNPQPAPHTAQATSANPPAPQPTPAHPVIPPPPAGTSTPLPAPTRH